MLGMLMISLDRNEKDHVEMMMIEEVESDGRDKHVSRMRETNLDKMEGTRVVGCRLTREMFMQAVKQI